MSWWAEFRVPPPSRKTPTKAAHELVPGDVIAYLRSNGWVKGRITRLNEPHSDDRIVVNVDSEPHGYLLPQRNRRFYVVEAAS